MSYRQYIWVADKKKLAKIKKMNPEQLWEFIGEQPEEWDFGDDGTLNPPFYCDVLEKAGAERVYELGESYVFDKLRDFKFEDYLKKLFKDKTVHEDYNQDTECMIAKPELLEKVIETMILVVKNFYESLLKEDSTKPEDDFGHPLKPQYERLVDSARSQLRWLQFVNDTDNKWSLGTSWLFEYEMFNLIHIKKLFDPKKHVLVWTAG